jgi:hypothetical protein
MLNDAIQLAATLSFSGTPVYNGHRIVELVRDGKFIECRMACKLTYRLAVPLTPDVARRVELPLSCPACLT